MLRAFHGAFALAVVSLAVSTPATAHHSAAVAYDINKTISVKGVISEVKWENPHTWIFVETKDESGKTVKWGFEGKVPNQLIRLGITPSVLKPGAEVTVTGHPARDASQNYCEVLEVTFADGKTIKP
jgi:DNA/RNA endonuclease YhcR with UshA esterase domain